MSTPYELLQAFRARHSGPSGGFAMSRLVLLARIIPEDITPDLDDPMLAERLAEAIDRIDAYEARRAAVKALVADARRA